MYFGHGSHWRSTTIDQRMLLQYAPRPKWMNYLPCRSLWSHATPQSFGKCIIMMTVLVLFFRLCANKNWFMKTQSIKNENISKIYDCLFFFPIRSTYLPGGGDLTGEMSCSYMNFINNGTDTSSWTVQLSPMWILVAAVGKANAGVAYIRHQHQPQLYASRRSTYHSFSFNDAKFNS